MNKELLKFIRYCLVGMTNFLIDIGIFNLLLHVRVSPYIASSISFLAAATNSYFLNRAWTFKDEKGQKVARQYTLFMLMSAVGLLINNLTLYLILHYTFIRSETITANVGKLTAIVTVLIWSYSMSRFVIFKPTKN